MPNVLRLRRLAAALSIVCASAGCAEPFVGDDGAQTLGNEEDLSEGALTDAEVEDLVREYMFKYTTGAETASIFARIRALDAREARLFHEHVGRLNGYTGVERRLFDAGFEYALAHGKSFLDLTAEDRVLILAAVTGAPLEELRAHCGRSNC